MFNQTLGFQPQMSNRTFLNQDEFNLTHPPFRWSIMLLIANVTILLFLHLIKRLKASLFREIGKVPVDLPVINAVKRSSIRKAREFHDSQLGSLIDEGCRKYPHEGFQLLGPEGYTVILPPNFLSELKHVPESVLEFHNSIKHAIFGSYDWINFDGPVYREALLRKLTPSIGKLFPGMVDETKFAVDSLFPTSADWTEVTISPVLVRSTALVAGRILLGSNMNRSEEWLRAYENYFDTIFAAASKMHWVKSVFKPIAAPFFSDIRKLMQFHRIARRVHLPLMMDRLKTQAENPSDPKPENLSQWVLDASASASPPVSLGRQVEQHLALSTGSVGSTSRALIHILYDLATHHEYLEPLRKEINTAFSEGSGILTVESLKGLVKLESFMKESQRLNQAAYVAALRATRSSITLSNGLVLPSGTLIGVSTSAIALDPKLWEDPLEFRGFRFADLRSETDKSYKPEYRFFHSGRESISFGFGRHACPGRFLVDVQLKLFLAYFIRDYDIKLANEREGRPPNEGRGFENLPAADGKVLVRRRVSKE